MIKVVLFDFYGVFLPDAYNAWLTKNNLKREGVFADVVNELDRGDISEADFLGRLSALTNQQVERIDIHGARTELNAPLVELLYELKPHYTIGLLSNASRKLRAKLDDLKLTPLFDTILISSEIGYAKPSHEAFRFAIEQFGVPASEIVFIDDNDRNIEAAREDGLLTMHYTDVPSLREALKDNGIFIKTDLTTGTETLGYKNL